METTDDEPIVDQCSELGEEYVTLEYVPAIEGDFEDCYKAKISYANTNSTHYKVSFSFKERWNFIIDIEIPKSLEVGGIHPLFVDDNNTDKSKYAVASMITGESDYVDSGYEIWRGGAFDDSFVIIDSLSADSTYIAGRFRMDYINEWGSEEHPWLVRINNGVYQLTLD